MEILKITYQASSFPRSKYGNKLSGHNTLDIDWRDVVWAAITVGKRNKSQVAAHGMYSCCEIVNRSSLIWMSMQSDDGYLMKTDIYQAMDPTEKVFVSFSLGMTMAKLFAEKLLGTPWLEHVSNVNNSIYTRAKTKSRPDLIGINFRNEFIIVEAKGRTHKMDRSAQKKAKLQTKVISKIDGMDPSLRVATQSYFNDYLEVALEDPDEVDENSIEISVNREQYFRSYYQIFASLSHNEIKLLKRSGIELDFSENLKNAFEKNEYGEIFIDPIDEAEDASGYKCFGDGIKIRMNNNFWSEQSLGLSPVLR